MNGVIFDLKRFAVHDGGGIRSTLFLKGCPLNCPWCHNPEGLTADIEPVVSRALCLKCGLCVRACARRALAMGEDGVRIDPARCARCGACAEACPTGAMRLSGEGVTPEEAASRLLRDRAFFGADGGVTLSGGEALYQLDFALALLALIKREGVDTAVETCLMLPTEALQRTVGLIDHYLIDIKLIDSDAHQAIVGAPNALILRNFEFLIGAGRDVLVRIPLIPGYTATEDNVRGIARYVAGVSPGQRVELINYNPLGKGKYAARNQPYPVEGAPFSDAEMGRFAAMLTDAKLQVVRD